MAETTKDRYLVERRIKGRWRETSRLDFNPLARLTRLPEPHLRRVTDVVTGDVWTWTGKGYQITSNKGTEPCRTT